MLMKKHTQIIVGLAILTSNSLHAQTFFVSSISAGGGDAADARHDRWYATSFTTASQPARVDSMTAVIRLYDGSTMTGFDEFISIYSNSVSNSPDTTGTAIGTFQDNPSQVPISSFAFTPDGTINLEADTTYWMVFGLNVDDPADPNLGNYLFEHNWRQANANDEGDAGWSIGDRVWRSTDQGSSWQNAWAGASAFRIDGTIIPEPSEYAFAIGIGLIAFATFRRIRISQTS